MGKLDEIGQSEHWEGEMDRTRTSSKNGPFSGPMVGNGQCVSTNISETRNVYLH